MDRETLHAVRTDSFGAGWTAAYTEVTSGDQNRRYIDLLNAHLALASPASPRVETELGCLKADDANAARCRCGYSPDVHLLRDALASLRAAPAPEGETPRFRAVVSADYKAGYAKGSEDCRRAAEGRAIIQKAIDRHHQRASPAPTPEGRETASLSREDREQAIQAAYQSAVYACTAKFLKYDERMAEARRLLKLAPKP